jgi:putative inorganic carbon (hco3(-)) transporter
VMLIPLIWVWWRPRQYIRNVFFILAPSALLIWGIYLTHSRGGLLALVVIVMLALKDRVNWALTLLAGVLAMGAALALDFTGGREISLEAGADRLSIWSDGLELFKSSPVFGVGFHQFQTYIGHTAHNSFLICAAELGVIAYFLWLGLITFTVVDLNSLIAWIRKGKRDNFTSSRELQAGSQENTSVQSESRNEDYDRWARALRLSLVGFLAAAWFLSRAYIITLYVLLGMAVTLVWMARNEGQEVDRKTVFRLSAVTVGLGIAIIGAIYVFVRVGHYFLGA